MKNRAITFMLALFFCILCCPLSTRASSEYGIITVKKPGSDQEFTLDAAKMEKKTVKFRSDYIQDSGIDDQYLSSFHEAEAYIITIRPDCKITVKSMAWFTNCGKYYGNDMFDIIHATDGPTCNEGEPKLAKAELFDFWADDMGVTAMMYNTDWIDGLTPEDGSTPYIIIIEDLVSPFPKFKDIEPSAYYYNAANWALYKGIAAGTTDTTFSPYNTCTRGQILTFIYRAQGDPKVSLHPAYHSDIDKITNWINNDKAYYPYYYHAAQWSFEQGIITGNTFDASTPCTRADAVTYLWKVAGSPVPSKDVAFTDVPSHAAYATAVNWAVEKGITNGTTETTFSPNQVCTRGQIVTFLYRAYENANIKHDDSNNNEQNSGNDNIYLTFCQSLPDIYTPTNATPDNGVGRLNSCVVVSGGINEPMLYVRYVNEANHGEPGVFYEVWKVYKIDNGKVTEQFTEENYSITRRDISLVHSAAFGFGLIVEETGGYYSLDVLYPSGISGASVNYDELSFVKLPKDNSVLRMWDVSESYTNLKLR